MIATITLALAANNVRPLTDMVSVVAPNVMETAIEAILTVYPGPDGNLVLQKAQEQLSGWLTQNALLGRDLQRSAVISRLHVEGVHSVDLIQPAEDLVAGAKDAVLVTNIQLSLGGVDE